MLCADACSVMCGSRRCALLCRRAEADDWRGVVQCSQRGVCKGAPLVPIKGGCALKRVGGRVSVWRVRREQPEAASVQPMDGYMCMRASLNIALPQCLRAHYRLRR
jgi:hypothetical protein